MRHKKFRFDFRKKTCIMGVLNITPDSFSDGNLFFDRRRALKRAAEMVAEGADVIDIGGESTRPGAAEVNELEELSRVIPVIESVADKLDVPISIDTNKAVVAKSALDAGATIINDVSGLMGDSRMADVAAKCGAFVIAMHIKGSPRTMQKNPRYSDLIKEIKSGLRKSVEIAIRAGVDPEMIAVDPGIGFGKTLRHNLEILNRLDEFRGIGNTICIGTSRKSFIGKILSEDDPRERIAGTIATSVLAITKGAGIIRVHDVRVARQAASMIDAIIKTGRA